MTAPAQRVALFRPDPDALISTLFRMGGDGAIATIAAADGGWGQEGTADLLRGLRERGGFEPGIDSQDLENLALASLAGRETSVREWLRGAVPDLVTPSLASAVLVRASGEPSCAGNDFWGLEGSVAFLESAALAMPAPVAGQAASLFAWRLEDPIEPPYGNRCFLWLALAVLSACDRSLGIAVPELSAIARETLAADAATAGEGGDGDGLPLRFRVEGPRWIELVDLARERLGADDGGELGELFDRIRTRMGEAMP